MYVTSFLTGFIGEISDFDEQIILYILNIHVKYITILCLHVKFRTSILNKQGLNNEC